MQICFPRSTRFFGKSYLTAPGLAYGETVKLIERAGISPKRSRRLHPCQTNNERSLKRFRVSILESEPLEVCRRVHCLLVRDAHYSRFDVFDE